MFCGTDVWSPVANLGGSQASGYDESTAHAIFENRERGWKQIHADKIKIKSSAAICVAKHLRYLRPHFHRNRRGVARRRTALRIDPTRSRQAAKESRVFRFLVPEAEPSG